MNLDLIRDDGFTYTRNNENGSNFITWIRTPKKSGWNCEICGKIYNTPEDCVPNWFSRFCQRIFFGIKWTKV